MLLSRFKIIGHSMMPSFSPNDNLIASVLPYIFSTPKVGDVIILEKETKQFIKRIKKIDNEKYFVVGDHKNDSQDSRDFGFIDREQIKGKVLFKL